MNKGQFESVFFKHFRKFFIPMIVFSVVMNVIVFSTSLSQMMKEDVELNRYENEIDSELSDSMFHEIETIASNILIDDKVRAYLLDGISGYMGEGGVEYVQERLSAYSGNNKYINSIYVYSLADDFVVTAHESKKLSEFDDAGFLQEYIRQTDETKVWARKKNNKFPYFISICKKIEAENKNGGIIVNIDIEDFVDRFNAENPHEKVYILNEHDGFVYYSGNTGEMLKKHGNGTFIAELLRNDDGIFEYQNKKFIKSQVKSKYYDWSYVLVKDFEIYNDKTSYFYFNMLVMNLVVFIISMIISFFAGKSTLKNIIHLNEIIDDTEKFNQKLKDSEVGRIAEKILQLVHRNKALREELEHRNLLITMEQIKNLQFQIGPHFINNTLNFISLLFVSEVGKHHSGIKMIKLMSKYLNSCLDVNNILITVEKEIENTKIYLDILKYKNDDLFTVKFDVDEQILNKQIIKFSLQPIIENAIVHGFLEGIQQNPQLLISVRQEGEKGIIEVSDNGVGMTDEKISELMTYINDETEETEHIGLKNVNKRAKLMYGDEYGLLIEKSEADGVCVKLTIPLAG